MIVSSHCCVLNCTNRNEVACLLQTKISPVSHFTQWAVAAEHRDRIATVYL